jgi:hypothetical protein
MAKPKLDTARHSHLRTRKCDLHSVLLKPLRVLRSLFQYLLTSDEADAELSDSLAVQI